MGGLESEVTDATRNVLLEGASWNFINIRSTVASQKLPSEAGYRFSRGVHPALALLGTRQGLDRMADWAGGVIAADLVDAYPLPYQDPEIVLKEADVKPAAGHRSRPRRDRRLLTRPGVHLPGRRETGQRPDSAAPPGYRRGAGRAWPT